MALSADGCINHLNSNLLLDGREANDIHEASARLLYLAIRWTKTIPSFSHVGIELFEDKNDDIIV